MARRNDKRKQTRRQQIAVRSRQAHINEALRDYSTGRLPKLTFTALGKLSDAQIMQVAQRVGEDYEAQRIGLAMRDMQKFEAQPNIKLTKYEQELVQRPDITDAEIAAAPTKRRKTLRQQQRRRRAAKDKRRRIQQYNAALMDDYTIGEVRDMEARGESPFDVIEGAGVHETARDYLLRTRENILSDRDFVRSMLRGTDEQRAGIINQILTQAGISGLKAGAPRNLGGALPWASDWSRVARKLEAFDNEINQKFDKLTNAQKNWLITSTNFASLIDQSTHYNKEEHKWELNSSGGMPDVEMQLNDWLDEAANR